MCTEQNVTVGVPERERAAQKPSNDEYHHAPRILAGRGFIKGESRGFIEGENHRVGLEGVLVEQDGRVRVASVRNELFGNVGDVITGFLKNNRMKSSASRCNDVGGVPAR